MSLTKQRIYYIDALKALAIVWIVMIHVPQHIQFDGDFWGKLAGIFAVPLFFTLSGMMSNVEDYKIKKRLKVLVPFLFFGITCTLCYGKSLTSFLLTMDKNGYWFLWVIIVYSISIFVIHKTHINKHLGFALFGILYVALYTIFPRAFRYLFSINLIILYWPFVYVGILLRNNKIIDVCKKYYKAILMLLVCNVIIYVNIKTLGAISMLFQQLLALMIIMSLIIGFSKLYGKASANNRIQKYISSVGQETLQIYVLHYFFFLPFDSAIFKQMTGGHSSTAELFINPFLSVIITMLCYLFAKTIYNVHLGFLFGR